MYKKIMVICLLVCGSSFASNLGSFDPTFSQDGNSDGWDIQSSNTNNIMGSGIKVDSEGRAIAASILDNSVRVLRYLTDGSLDVNFDTDGLIVLPKPIDGVLDVGISMGESNDFFVAYSFEFCAGNACDFDIVVYHVDSLGVILSSIDLAIDLGGGGKNDEFANIQYISSLGKLAILSTSFRAPPQDTDFAMVLLDVDLISGSMSVDANFADNGIASCFFNHENISGSADVAESIVWSENNSSIILGGSAFEGNGLNGLGRNLAFCELDLQGLVMRKWSTLGTPSSILDSERLVDMKLYSNGLVQSLLVASNVNTQSTSLEFAVSSYFWSFIQNDWILDNSFGGNGNGWNLIGFEGFVVGQSDDFVSSMVLEESGRFILAGQSKWVSNGITISYMSLAKFNLDGSLDNNWGLVNNGRIVHDFNTIGFDDSIDHMALDPKTEAVLISGTTFQESIPSSFVGKLINDRIFKNSFE